MKTILKAVLVSAAIATASYAQASEVKVSDNIRELSCEMAGEFGALAKKGHLIGLEKGALDGYMESSKSFDSYNMHRFTVSVLDAAYKAYPYDSDTTKTVEEKSKAFGEMVRKTCLELGVY